MRLTSQKTLILGLFIAVLLADCRFLYAGQKIQPIMNNAELRREMSTDEMLRYFQTQREQLLSQRSQDKESHLLKNKIKILDGKITFLENELKRGNVTPAPPAVIKPAVKLKAPIAVQPAPFAKSEPRRRIFVAMTQPNIKPQPSQKPSGRLAPATQTVPKKVSMRSAVSSEREKPAVASLALKRPVGPPLAVRPLSSGKPSERAQPMMRAVSQKIKRPVVPGQKTAKTGRDWKKMTEAEKDIYVLSIMGNLGRRDVFLEKSHGFYIREIDNRLQQDPSLENEYVHKILIASAYENEPESRRDIDKIGK